MKARRSCKSRNMQPLDWGLDLPLETEKSSLDERKEQGHVQLDGWSFYTRARA